MEKHIAAAVFGRARLFFSTLISATSLYLYQRMEEKADDSV